MSIEQYLATATHEAGHAVVGEVLGFRCCYIKGAFCMHDRRTTRLIRTWPNSPKGFKQYHDYAVASIAGIAAEAVDAGDIITDIHRTVPGAEDYKAVKELAGKVSVSKIDLQTLQPVRSEASLIAEWEERAMELVRTHWNWIQNVANFFVECEGRLTGDDVRSCAPRTRKASR